MIWVRVTVWSDAGAGKSSQVAIAMIEDITETKLAGLELQQKACRLERVIAPSATSPPRRRETSNT